MRLWSRLQTSHIVSTNTNELVIYNLAFVHIDALHDVNKMNYVLCYILQTSVVVVVSLLCAVAKKKIVHRFIGSQQVCGLSTVTRS